MWFRKIVMVLVVLIALMGNVSAVTPDYDLRVLLNETLDYGSNKIGEMVLVDEGYVPDTIPISNFTNYTADRYDKIIWRGESTVDVILEDTYKTSISKGDKYQLRKNGRYRVVSVGNSSNYATIRTRNPENNRVKINIKAPDGIELYTDRNGIEIEDSEENVDIFANVSRRVNPGEYKIRIDTNNSFLNKSEIYFVDMPLFSEWEIVNDTIKNYNTLQAGEVIEVGTMRVRNIGNAEFDVKAELMGNASKFLNIQNSLLLYERNSVYFQLYAQIPLDEKSAIYKSNLRIYTNDSQYTKNITLNITDKIPPKILNISWQNNTVYKESSIIIKASDNVLLDNCVFIMNNMTYDSEFKNKVCTLYPQINKSKKYFSTIKVYDSNGNINETTENIPYDKMKAISEIGNVDMSTVKYGKRSVEMFFNITENLPEPIVLELEEYSTDSSNITIGEDYEIEVEYGNGVQGLFTEDNKTVKISDKGSVYLIVKNKNVTNYYGEIKVRVPEFVESDRYNILTKFEGRSASYGLPNPFSKEWPGGHTLFCDVEDTGNLETSKYDCEYKYNIQGGEERNVMVPVSVSEWESIQNRVDETEQEMKKKILFRDIVITSTIGIIVFLGFISAIMVKVAPVTRILRNK